MARLHLAVLAMIVMVAACSVAANNLDLMYGDGEPRPSIEHCRALERQHGAKSPPGDASCRGAVAGNTSDQLQLAEQFRQAGDRYRWLYWLARAASGDSDFSAPVDATASDGGGPPSAAHLASEPPAVRARAMIDEMIDAARAASPDRGDGSNLLPYGGSEWRAKREEEGPDALPFGLSCGECTTGGKLEGCFDFPQSEFIAIGETPSLVETVSDCLIEPGSGAVRKCGHEEIQSIVEFETIEILHDTRGREKPRYYSVTDHRGVIADTQLMDEILKMDQVVIFSNVGEHVEGGYVPSLVAACSVAGPGPRSE